MVKLLTYAYVIATFGDMKAKSLDEVPVQISNQSLSPDDVRWVESAIARSISALSIFRAECDDVARVVTWLRERYDIMQCELTRFGEMEVIGFHGGDRFQVRLYSMA